MVVGEEHSGSLFCSSCLVEQVAVAVVRMHVAGASTGDVQPVKKNEPL